MNKILKGICFVVLTIAFVSCNKDDDKAEDAQIIPYATQYPVDLDKIETFLKTHSITIIDNPGFSNDRDVTFVEVPSLSSNSIWGSDPVNPSAMLKTKSILRNDVNYKIYFLNISKKYNSSYDPDYYGENISPSKVDSIFVSYKGVKLDNTKFDEAIEPVWFNLDRLVIGWGEILPMFKTGNHNYDAASGHVDFENFGAGVMFLPSGLAYYNLPQASIPAYSPIIFNFKLMKLNYVDHDYDRIDSKDEISLGVNGEYADTDGDGYPDFYDQDDDNDGYSTKNEIRNPVGGYFDFSSIPTCPDGKKRHLTKSCHN